MPEVTLNLSHMSGQGPYHYANWNPDDPWLRENYVKVRLDRRTLDELGEPEHIEVVIRAVT